MSKRYDYVTNINRALAAEVERLRDLAEGWEESAMLANTALGKSRARIAEVVAERDAETVKVLQARADLSRAVELLRNYLHHSADVSHAATDACLVKMEKRK